MKLFRFTAKDALIATTLAAVWCGALSQHMSVWDAFGNDRLFMAPLLRADQRLARNNGGDFIRALAAGHSLRCGECNRADCN